MTFSDPSWVLPPEIEARLGGETLGPQRVIAEAGQVLIVLHEPPGSGDSSRRGAYFLRDVSGRLTAPGNPDGAAGLKELLERYRQLFHECDKVYDAAVSAKDLFQLLERLAPLNRTSTNLASALQWAREACKEDRFLIRMRDESHELSRSFELLTGDARLALDYHIARNQEEQARRSVEMAESQHKLNILAAFTFPVMALATLMGMNLNHGLGTRSAVVFGSVLGVGIALGFFVKGWAIKRRR